MLLVPTHPTLIIFQKLPIPEGAPGEAMTDPRKRGDQSTIHRPHMTAIPDELGEYIAWYALLVRDLGWEGLVR